MNRKYSLFFILLIIIALAIGFSITDGSSAAEVDTNSILFSRDNEISKLIKERKNKSYFTEYSILKKSPKTSLARLDEFTKKADIYLPDKNVLHNLYTISPQDVIIKIESKDYGLFELELTKMNFAPQYLNIQVKNGNNIRIESFRTGISYNGIIKGNNNSLASLTVFENCVLGLVCSDKGNFVLGPKKDENSRFSDDFVFYNDKDLMIKNNFYCGADNLTSVRKDDLLLNSNHTRNISNSSGPTDSIRVYFVADYQMYLDNSSSIQQTGIFINSVFNNTALLYYNEQIPVRLAPSISVFTSPDPYMSLNNSMAILNLFGSNTQDAFEGDLAHLLSTGHGQQLGGIAWINVLCQPYVYIQSQNYHYGRFAFSNIENSFLPYPTYSWTVEVITHEMGHNVASQHTHACVWPTISGQIDSCYTSEGGCVIGTQPNTNGTIMSYCHLNGAINLVNGFGPLPGDTIRLGYQYALCLDTMLNSSEVPLAFDLMQNYPNPFNPGTSIRFALPEKGFVTLKVYDITGKEVATLVKDKFYEAGLFNYEFNAAVYNLASGVYIYKMDVNNNNSIIYSHLKKMVYVK